jgi:Ca-activated chloride channel homolog
MRRSGSVNRWVSGRWSFVLGAVLFAITPLLAQTGQPPQNGAGQDDSTPTFKVDVKLVNLFVTVLNQDGAPVSSLKKENFELLEDGHPEKIAIFNRESELPLSIVLGIDASLSTRKDLKLELESARRFARSIVRPIDALSLFEFSEVVNEIVPFTSDLQRRSTTRSTWARRRWKNVEEER